MVLKITALLENQVFAPYKTALTGKPGLSLLIQDQDTTILFDTGPDGSFIFPYERFKTTVFRR
ncbi:hypothetical protein [Xenorhabdus bovienii]|uniref:hypothetical protein n=1 Tax=Xenorhabdus bovienii TaxID=40576 RepID=UPI00061D3C81|nr:hypothetical protein [Xenorhabdus bovienii]